MLLQSKQKHYKNDQFLAEFASSELLKPKSKWLLIPPLMIEI